MTWLGAGARGLDEKARKEQKLRALMSERGLSALLLRRVSSFAWATGGAPGFINAATDAGVASLLYTPDGAHLLTSVIEAPRMEAELGLAAQGFDFEVHPWSGATTALERFAKGGRLGVDLAFPGASDAVDVSLDVARLRASLEDAEAERLRDVGARSAAAMDETARTVRAGETELEIASRMAAHLLSRGAWPIVLQVAADERVFSFRHALPTERRVDRYVLLSFCARRAGLVASISRLVHLGPVPDELRQKERAVATVDATYLANAKPGAKLADIFAAGVAAYAATGFGDEWTKHHQGGVTGYETREALIHANSKEIVAQKQAFAFNPTIAGTKSEDTVLVDGSTLEIVTQIPGWPTVDVEIAGRRFERPAILEIAPGR